MGSPESIIGSAGANNLASDQLAQLWKNLFDASPDAQVVCRADGATERINLRAARLLKLASAERDRGICLFDALLPPADLRLKDLLRRLTSQPDVLHSVTVIAPGGTCGLIDLEVTPLELGQALIVFKDASRRLRLESHVQRLMTAVDSTPEVFFITDADFRLTFVNPAFQTLTGYSIEEVIGRADAFLRAPTEQEKVNAYLEVVRRGREWTGELANVRKDGTCYQVEAKISPIFDRTGEFTGCVACEHDITLRLRLQNELRLERDFIHSILMSLDVAIYTVDREFRLTHANDGWRRLPSGHGGFRMAGAPELGRALLEYVPDPVRRGDLQQLFQEALRNGGVQENRYLAGDDRNWLTRISPWVHAGEVRGLICSVTDQTHYHELQNQLFQSQKMEIIGTLAAGIAHDFNNLLQAIRGNVTLMLLETAPGSNLQHWADQICVATSRAAEITQQLLSFSRESEERRTVLDLNEVIQEAGQLARRTLRGNVVLDLVPLPEPIPVRVDPTRANQALLNLCVNAQDAMPEGGRLTITNTILTPSPEQLQLHSLNTTGEFAVCSVSDTGSGIPKEILPRIFEPFFTTKARGKGTGLGLPIIQSVMQEAGGFVDVETVPGHGTTFRLYFPLILEELPAARPETTLQFAHGSGRVLVVDDLDLLRDFAKNFLQAAGLTVLVASNGQEALKVLAETSEPVDLLFTDYSMPGMNGIELIERVGPQWPAIRLVLSSGYLDEAARRRLQNLNVSVLFKPYDMREAAELIVQSLGQKR
jgi:two-component system, cell cycle sensor histidine kinase and response regulator CckA